MAQENSISQELADLLVTNNFDPEYRDEGGKSSGPGDANTISFDYRSTSGNNYGSAVAVIGDENELMLFFGDNLGRSMQDQDKDEWFGFLTQMRKLAQSHRYSFSPQNLSRLKHSLAGQAAVKEGLFEGYYGSRRESFIGEPTDARILIKHNKMIGEDDKRYRYIESIFIETSDGERFKLQSNRLIHGRAMLEHVRSGGRPYDVRGNHINEMVQELAVLARFNRAKQHHVYEGVTQELVESAAHYYRSLQENLKRISSSRGYHAYFESWAPDQIDQQESLVEDLKNMFVQQTLDTRIEAALPTLAKIQQQGTKMKEAEIFENYMNRLSEGTWALPDTPEAYEKLQQLMTGELIVGADAMNATEQLYDLVGDDELFDILNDLAEKSQGRANIWDDSDVQRRLAELGVQTPQSTQAEPADVPQDTAPPAVPPVAEGFGDTITRGIRKAANAIIPGLEKDAGDYGAGKWDKNTNTNRNNLIDWITLNQLDYYEDELLDYFDKFVDGGGSEYKAGEQAVNTWKARMKRDGESVRKPEDVAESKEIRNKKGTLLGTWDGRTFAMDPGLEQRWAEENGEDWVEDFKARKTAELQQQSAPSEDSIKYYANELEKYDVQAGQPRQSRQQYYDLAVQMLSGAQGLAEAGIDDIRPSMQSSRTEPSPRPQVPRVPMTPFGTKPPKNEAQLDEIGDTEAGQSMLNYYVNTAVDDAVRRSNTTGYQKGARTAAELQGGPSVGDNNKFEKDPKIDQRQRGIGKAITRLNRGPVGGGGGSGFGGVKPGQSPSLDNPIQNENAELARMLKHAGVPLKEGVLTDSTGSTMDHIQDRFRRDIKDFTETGDMSDDLYDALYDYYFDDMPYGTKKARTGDPHEWVSDRFASDLGINENLISPMIMPVSEGSCNMTMEGSYCPEHGLAECGMYEQFLSEPIAPKPDPTPDVNFVTSPPVPPKFTNQTATGKVDYSIAPKLTKAQGLGNKLDMDEDGGAVGMPYSMGEAQAPQDPINSNSAMTGSYYEGKETDIQEGDALLARIKSLALLR